MKKSLSLLLVIVILLSFLPTLSGTAAERALSYVSASDTLWLDTFQDGNVSGYYIDAGDNTREVVSDPDDPTNKVYHIVKDTYCRSKTMRWYGAEQNGIYSGYTTTQFDIRFSGSQDYDWDYWELFLRLNPYTECQMVEVRTDSRGNCYLSVNDGGTWEMWGESFPEETWHTISISVNQSVGCWNLYFDGQLIQGDIKFANNAAKTSRLHAFYFVCGNSSVKGNEIYLDNVCGYRGTPNTSGVPQAPTATPTQTPTPTEEPSSAPITTPKPWDEDDLTVAFIGGSITEGTGASSLSRGYAGQVGEWFRETYSDKNVNVINAGFGGTASNFGMFRLKNQVIDQSPDIVFVEFAVNDWDYGDYSARKYMEGIVRSLLNAEKVPQIVFVYTTRYFGSFQSMKASHQVIADYYGIPVIDVGAAIEAKVSSGTNVYSLLGDGVHPTQAGHNLYAQTIINCLSTQSSTYLKAPTPRENPFISGNIVYQPRTVNIWDNGTRTGNWTSSTFRDGSGAPATEMKISTSGAAGSEISFTFYGKYIGFSYVMSSAVGSVTYYIDGVRAGTYSTQYSAINYEKGTATILRDNLSEGWHTIRLVVNEGNPVKLGDFLIDDGAIRVSEYPYEVKSVSVGTYATMVTVERNEIVSGNAPYLMVAAYDSNHRLLAMGVKDISEGGVYSVPMNLSGKTVAKTKAWVWDSFSGMTPLSTVYGE